MFVVVIGECLRSVGVLLNVVRVSANVGGVLWLLLLLLLGSWELY